MMLMSMMMTVMRLMMNDEVDEVNKDDDDDDEVNDDDDDGDEVNDDE